MNIATANRDHGSVIRASWLTADLLLLWVQAAAPADHRWRLLIERGTKTVEQGARSLRCAHGVEDHIAQPWLLTVHVPVPGGQLGTVVALEDDAGRRTLLPESVASVVCELDAFGAAARAEFDDLVRTEIQGFVAGASLHPVDSPAQLGSSLLRLRDSMRERLATTKLEPGPCSARLEDVTALDDRAFWLTGWVHDAAPESIRFTAVSPEGEVSRVRPEAVTFHPRLAYARTLHDDAVFRTVGYHAFVELTHPSRHPDGWVMEFRTTAGREVEHTAFRPVHHEVEPIRKMLQVQLRAQPLDEAALVHQVLPTISRLRGGPDTAQIIEVVELGGVPQDPEISVVVAVRRADRIDHQLLSFAHDPDFAEVELIYVAFAPDPEALIELVEGMHDLHGVPFRLATVTRAPGRARALNLGASLARGRRLVLMGGEVFPSDPGWVQTLARFLDDSAMVGAVGPRLLHEDDSIAHAGAGYVRRSTGRWRRASPFAGLARAIDGAGFPRPVDALSDACLMIDRKLFEASGGFSELYMPGGDEIGDLCLRLAETAEVWYAPDAELYLLDEFPPFKPSREATRFNSWLFEHRCGARLAGRSGLELRPASPRRSRVKSIPGFGSGRGAPRVEITDVETAPIDRDVLHDGGLRTPVESAAYDGTYSFLIEGWANPVSVGVATVEIRSRGQVLRRAPVPFPYDSHGSDHRHEALPAHGFTMILSSLELELEFQLDVAVATEDGRTAPLGRIRGRRKPLRSGYSPALQPLLITTIGRSGSAWLVALLTLHPEILAVEPFRFEAKLTSYWMDVLRTLAEPASYIQMIRPQISSPAWWLGERQTPPPLHVDDTASVQWLGCENVEVLAGFCQSRFDAFYDRLARSQGLVGVTHFVEKCFPGPAPRLIAELYPEGRELVLVRDFRDMICSIDAYNEKRGFELWGRDANDTDEAWLGHLRAEAVKLLEGWRTRRDRSLLVRYEELVREPAATLVSVCSYVGLDVEAPAIERMIELAESLNPDAQRFHQTSASAEESIGRWKRDLSAERVALCSELFDDILVEFGYEPTTGNDAAGASLDLHQASSRFSE